MGVIETQLVVFRNTEGSFVVDIINNDKKERTLTNPFYIQLCVRD